MEGLLDHNGLNKRTSQLINSGDMVFKDKDGVFYWAGRKLQTIKINGYFININLLHNYFDRIEGVKRSFVLYDEHANKIYGFFEVKDDIDLDLLKADLINKYKNMFPTYPRLARVMFLEKIPLTETGKINIQKLKQLATEIKI